jgi:FSR family fosmidomycin resistance protein-like MFS transporter
VAALILLRRPPVPRLATARPQTDAVDEPQQWGRFTYAAIAACLRTGLQFGLQAFVPLFVWKELHIGHTAANTTATVLLVAGAAGTLLGGRLADRIGFERLVRRSMLLLPLLVAPLPFVPIEAVFVLMALIGLAMDANFYPLVVIGQAAVPRRVGFASGIVLGVSIGFGALTASVLGVIADHVSLTASLVAVTVLGAAAYLATLPLAEQLGRHRTPRVG